MTFSSTRQNLLIDVQGSNLSAKPGDSAIDREITIINQGAKVASVDLWLEPADGKSSAIRSWYQLSARSLPLMVEAGGKAQVTLRLEVPQQAEPETYSYDVCAQAVQYPGEVLRSRQQLQVVPSEQDSRSRREPIFTLNPPSSADAPYPIAPGDRQSIQITIKNRSIQVDYFSLRAPELDEAWLTLLYPEVNPNQSGIVTREAGLRLNPEQSGEVTLLLHPPIYTPPGIYLATLRLISDNQQHLILLDILYIQVPIVDRLAIEDLQPPTRKFPGASFTIDLRNEGNILRDLAIQAADEDRLFRYVAQPNPVQLLPGTQETIAIAPIPINRLRRPWREAQEIPFTVSLSELEGLNWSGDRTATLVWQPYSPWLHRLAKLLRWLLILAIVLLILSGLFLLARWLLLKLVVEPSFEPKILSLAATAESYPANAERRNPIRLNWEVSNPDRLDRVMVRYANSQDQAQDVEYSIAQLRKDCKPEERQRNNAFLTFLLPLYGKNSTLNVLVCQGWQTSISPRSIAPFEYQPDRYNVQLQIYEKQALSDEELREGEGNFTNKSWRPNWFSRNSTPPKEPMIVDARSIESIEITPPVTPAIAAFNSKTLIYRQASTAPNIGASPQYPAPPVRLTWAIDQPREVAAIELSSVFVAVDGTMQSRRTRYGLNRGVAIGLGCRLQAQLICEDVPTFAIAPGRYQFTLNVITRSGEAIAKTAEAIEIRPPLPQILDFRVNNQDVQQNPQIVQQVNPARGAVNLNLTWRVSPNATVELLPAPGMVDPAAKQFSIALNPAVTSTTLTLKVTNSAGESMTRSVVIENLPFVPPAPASPAAPPTAPMPTPPPPPNVPVPSSSRNGLPIYELPPRSN